MNSFYKIRKILFFYLFLYIYLIFAYDIPSERIFDWSKTGVSQGINLPVNIINVSDYNVIPNNQINQSDNLNSLISSFNGNPVRLFFPEGIYFLTSPIILNDNITIIGENPLNTRFIFNLQNNSQNCIIVHRSQTTHFTQITEGYLKHSKTISVNDISSFQIGDFVEYYQDNDSAWEIANEPWAANSVGQINKITNIVGNQIFLKNEIRFNYSQNLNPRIRKINPIKNVGIEKIYIERLGGSPGFYHNISFYYATESWVRGVESNKTSGSHICITASYGVQITGNYIHHANSYGGGGRAYGVTLQTRSSNNLIQDNIFKKLRHAMLLQTGANGNVIAYNYSTEPYWDDQYFFIPTDYPADLCLHGNYPYANLFEGNIIANLYIDNSHGANGPYNTFYRNRIYNYGIIMTGNHSHKQSIVGNEITKASGSIPPFFGQYNLTSQGHFLYGNNTRNNGTQPTNTNDLPLSDFSYYLDTNMPDFWQLNNVIPTIGFPNPRNTGIISAKYRYDFENQWLVFPEILPPPNFSSANISADSVVIVISSSVTNSIIYYSIGDEFPDYSSDIYNESFVLTQSNRVNTFLNKANHYPSHIIYEDFFILKKPVITDFHIWGDSVYFQWEHDLYSHLSDNNPFENITYKIYRKNNGETEFSLIAETQENYFFERNANQGSHQYFIKGTLENFSSSASNRINIVIQQTSPPIINPQSGIYGQSITCEIQNLMQNSQIYYKINNSDSLLYSTPIVITEDSELEVRAFKNGFIPSNKVYRFYSFLKAPNINNVTTNHNSITIYWTDINTLDTDNLENYGFNIYRNGIKYNDSIILNHSFTDTNVDSGIIYHYTITSVYNNQESEQSEIIEAQTGNYYIPAWTGNALFPMIFSIQSITVNNQPLNNGDEIAIFDNNLCVGSMKISNSVKTSKNAFNDNLTITTSANNPFIPEINGFIEGNTPIFKVFDSQNQLEITDLNIEYISGNPVFLYNSEANLNISKPIYNTQLIDLDDSWNIMSCMLNPLRPNFVDIFNELITEEILIKIQDETGNSFEYLSYLNDWVNNIGELNNLSAYRVKLNQNYPITIDGIEPEYPLLKPLRAGWNLIGFPYSQNFSAYDFFSELINNNNLRKVMDEAGNSIEFLESIGWVDNIEVLQPGKGYAVKVNEDFIFTFNHLDFSNNHIFTRNKPEKTVFFKNSWTGNGIHHFNVHILFDTSFELSIGDEIAVFDGEYCVGAIRVKNNNLISIITSANDNTTENINGFTEGNKFSLKLFKHDTKRFINNLEFEIIQGSDFFQKGSTSLIRVLMTKQYPKPNYISIYPNPISSNISIELYQIENSALTIEIFNIKGQKVSNIFNAYIEKGQHNLRFDLKTNNAKIASGVYFLRITNSSSAITKKILIIN